MSWHVPSVKRHMRTQITRHLSLSLNKTKAQDLQPEHATSGLLWCIKINFSTHSFSFLTCLLGTIAGHYYLLPGKACPYQFLISVSSTRSKLQLLNSPDHSPVQDVCVATLFWELTWLPDSPLSKACWTTCPSFLGSLFSSRDPEVLPIPSTWQLAHGFLNW